MSTSNDLDYSTNQNISGNIPKEVLEACKNIETKAIQKKKSLNLSKLNSDLSRLSFNDSPVKKAAQGTKFEFEDKIKPVTAEVSFSENLSEVNMPKTVKFNGFSPNKPKIRPPLKVSSPEDSFKPNCSSCWLQKEIKPLELKSHLDHVKFTSSQVETKILEAKILIRKRILAKSNKILLSLIKGGVFHADVFYLYGDSLRLSGRLDEAEKCLKKSLEFQLFPKQALFSLGLLYFSQKDYKAALDAFLKYNNFIVTI